MKKINLKIRLQNKTFWIAIIPAMLLFIQAVAGVFGYTLDFTGLNEKLLTVINTLFAVLAILGVVVDPTTPGTGDSERAMNRIDLNENEVDK